MARTVAARREPATQPSQYVYHGRGACGYCTIKTQDGVRHDMCVIETHTTAEGRKDDVVWKCQCGEKGHQP